MPTARYVIRTNPADGQQQNSTWNAALTVMRVGANGGGATISTQGMKFDFENSPGGSGRAVPGDTDSLEVDNLVATLHRNVTTKQNSPAHNLRISPVLNPANYSASDLPASDSFTASSVAVATGAIPTSGDHATVITTLFNELRAANAGKTVEAFRMAALDTVGGGNHSVEHTTRDAANGLHAYIDVTYDLVAVGLPKISLPIVEEIQGAVRHNDHAAGVLHAEVDNAAEQKVIEVPFGLLSEDDQEAIIQLWDEGAWTCTPISLTLPGIAGGGARDYVMLEDQLNIQHEGPRRKSTVLRLLDVTPP